MAPAALSPVLRRSKFQANFLIGTNMYIMFSRISLLAFFYISVSKINRSWFYQRQKFIDVCWSWRHISAAFCGGDFQRDGSCRYPWAFLGPSLHPFLAPNWFSCQPEGGDTPNHTPRPIMGSQTGGPPGWTPPLDLKTWIPQATHCSRWLFLWVFCFVLLPFFELGRWPTLSGPVKNPFPLLSTGRFSNPLEVNRQCTFTVAEENKRDGGFPQAALSGLHATSQTLLGPGA